MKKVLVILLILTSCSAGKYREPVVPGFFACTGWNDKNQDGIRDFVEFQDIKDIFRSNENVMFVGHFEVPVGSIIKLQIIAPDRSVYKELTFKQEKQASVFFWKQSVRFLVSNKLPGMWKGNWFANDQPVTTTLVTLER